jgi:hypothetical protein
MTGMLILHGFVYGYDGYRTTHVIKARRIFCSNRNRRKGCGRTLSYYLIEFLCRTLISARIAWQFLASILSGTSIEKAYDALDPECVLSISTFYRFWARFKISQYIIRTFIANYYTLSEIPATSPVLETLHHIRIHLSDQRLDPIAHYQLLSQATFI